MRILFVILSIVVVVAVLGAAAFILLVEPFVDHVERFRDRHGRTLGSSPRLD